MYVTTHAHTHVETRMYHTPIIPALLTLPISFRVLLPSASHKPHPRDAIQLCREGRRLKTLDVHHVVGQSTAGPGRRWYPVLFLPRFEVTKERCSSLPSSCQRRGALGDTGKLHSFSKSRKTGSLGAALPPPPTVEECYWILPHTVEATELVRPYPGC